MRTEAEAYLRRALDLAGAFVGQTAPNPPVGAVCVRAGRIIGEGAHQKAGTPHAEVNCLQDCEARGEDPAGATLYVTLEPCSTTGRTPPCCDLIRAKRLERVVIGCLDPNPRHAGRAVALLQAAGIAVDVLPEHAPVALACRDLIAPFSKAICEGLPFLRLKLAMTLDGAIADANGCSRWITGEAARARVQALRLRADAVMVGAETVRADHPSLQPHLPNAPAKWRILVDRSHPPAPADVDSCTWVATRDLGYDGHNLRQMLKAVCAKGVNEVLCEGGGLLAGALLEAGLVDELLLFYAPKALGDRAARPGLAIAPRALPEALGFTLAAVEQLGNDLLLTLKPKERPYAG